MLQSPKNRKFRMFQQTWMHRNLRTLGGESVMRSYVLFFSAVLFAMSDIINKKNNYIISTLYPFDKDFKGCKCFSKTNEIIRKQNGPEFEINWGK